MHSPIFGNDVVSPIYSPIAGRLFSCYRIPFGRATGNQADVTNFFFLIEIPEGEFVPATLQGTYRQFCHDVSENRKSLLQKCRDGSFAPWSDSEVDRVLAEVRSVAPIVLPRAQFL